MTTWRKTKRPAPQNSYGVLSHVGCVRTHNEDAVLAAPPLFAVADGMGGHAGGEVASSIAIQTLERNAPTIADKDVLTHAFREANLAIIDAASRGIGKEGMGTTLTSAVIDGNIALIGHVGDSRAYLLRDGNLEQITKDHSLVAELVAIGEITTDEAAVHPKRSIITRALGSNASTQTDIYEIELKLDDILLLCSDGLSGMVSDQDIRTILAMGQEPQDCAQRLVDEALAHGGGDNVSVVVLKINTAPLSLAKSTEVAAANAMTATNIDSLIKATGAADAAEAAEIAARRKRRARLSIIAYVALFFLLIGAACGGIYLYASNSAFLRLDDGKVCVYRGLPSEIIKGVRLEWLQYETDLTTDDLLPTVAEGLTYGIPTDSYNDAVALVAEYEKARAEKNAASASNASSGSSTNPSVSNSLGSSASPGSSANPSSSAASGSSNASGSSAASGSSVRANS